MTQYAPIQATPVSTAPWKKPDDVGIAVAADPSIVVEGYNNTDIDVMADLILQDIGAVELSMITRYDSLDGANVTYSPVASRTRLIKYSSNNLMGQPNSVLNANSSSALNAAHYIEGEINRGYSLLDYPGELDMDIQVAIVADVVPFSISDPVYEVI